ncbi:hypothetical protein FEM48_Zijuj07G0077000 [Ziziphus jujuba var. spinosa]|uniref:S-protein homolog n=1 Tax=Ziziphus jujuba var. spinosa TaxID=714518 RepID=A0A978V3C9_ZIZJJ|nr:hypothetical protein FEM48_Zijuj07G0077000 [Ziziphus jujuba var. spinosa]
MNPLRSSMVLLVVLAFISIFISSPVSANYTIEVRNNVHSTKKIDVHCKSADKDLSVHHLKYGENLDWNFNISNINLLSPVFDCDIIWEKVAKGHIVVFDARRVIVNYLGKNAILNLHCQSKDDDLGAHDLPYTDSFNWSFNVNIWKTTLYYCDMGSGDLIGHFDIFVAKRDMNRCGDDKCVWRVNRDVLYLYIKDVDDYVCQFDWPK